MGRCLPPTLAFDTSTLAACTKPFGSLWVDIGLPTLPMADAMGEGSLCPNVMATGSLSGEREPLCHNRRCRAARPGAGTLGLAVRP